VWGGLRLDSVLFIYRDWMASERKAKIDCIPGLALIDSILYT